MRRISLAFFSLGLALVSRADVPIYAYVVCGTNGTQMAASPATVSEYVKNLNAGRIKRLLMYGYWSETKLAISGGDIYGLGRKLRFNESTGEYDIVWDLFNVEVGFWEHGTRTPACE